MTPYIADARQLADAVALLHAFGAEAAGEAATRAARSRDLGNLLHFCRWRQIERLVALLADRSVSGTVH